MTSRLTGATDAVLRNQGATVAAYAGILLTLGMAGLLFSAAGDNQTSAMVLLMGIAVFTLTTPWLAGFLFAAATVRARGDTAASATDITGPFRYALGMTATALGLGYAVVALAAWYLSLMATDSVALLAAVIAVAYTPAGLWAWIEGRQGAAPTANPAA